MGWALGSALAAALGLATGLAVHPSGLPVLVLEVAVAWGSGSAGDSARRLGASTLTYVSLRVSPRVRLFPSPHLGVFLRLSWFSIFFISLSPCLDMLGGFEYPCRWLTHGTSLDTWRNTRLQMSPEFNEARMHRPGPILQVKYAIRRLVTLGAPPKET